MRKRPTAILLAAILALACAPLAPAQTQKRPHCRSHYVARSVRVRVRHGHRFVWVRRWRCVRVKATPRRPRPTPKPVPPPAPKPAVSYQAKVDPTFTQAAGDPFAVTYSYSADATAITSAGVKTDLAATQQLPAGVLNFYSENSPGAGGQQLACSMNVGGAATGGDCAMRYLRTGTYAVTTQYIPNGTAAVTQVDEETIAPYATTSTLSATPGPCGTGSPPGYHSVAGPYCTYTLAPSVIDQTGFAVGPSALLVTSPSDGAPASWQPENTQVAANGSCLVYATASWLLSPDCNFGEGSGLISTTGWNVSIHYGGTDGWSASTSASQVLTP